ncbi:hypothetical protein QYF36_013787 [Acer negundo]|nr:hypothetical protein QYF36_013787 [Acer negundo]
MYLRAFFSVKSDFALFLEISKKPNKTTKFALLRLVSRLKFLCGPIKSPDIEEVSAQFPSISEVSTSDQFLRRVCHCCSRTQVIFRRRSSTFRQPLVLDEQRDSAFRVSNFKNNWIQLLGFLISSE